MRNKFLLLIAIMLLSCQSQQSKPMIVVSNQPLMMIMQEIVGPKIQLECITKPGDSPHTYSPKPTDAAKAANATIFLYTSESLDAWTGNLITKKSIEVLNLVPNSSKLSNCETCAHHHHEAEANNTHQHKNEDFDPHFWTDPLTVKALLPNLVDTLAKLMPEYAQTFKTNADLFAKRLELLNKQIAQILNDKQGKSVFMFHPSFKYFINRYGLEYGGSIEVSPGKQPSPNYLKQLSDKIKATNTKAIFSEPQLSEISAKAVAENTGTILFVLDPLGGEKGRTKYSDLLLYNARILQKAL